MKTSADHITNEHAPAHPGAVDMNEPIYDGKWGYTTEAEKQALVASIQHAEQEYEEGKGIRADSAYWKARQERLIKELKAEGVPD
jgi:hypothetical protein